MTVFSGDFSGLAALFVNTSQNRRADESHTKLLMNASVAIISGLMHLAAMLQTAGGFPGHGNDRRAWSDGARFGFENPEYR